MTLRQFGDRATFCVELGEITPPSMRVVDLWAGGKWLTTDDNTAYLPSLIHYMRQELEEVRGGDIKACPFPDRTPEEIFHLLQADETEFRQQFWFLQWTEIVDNVSRYAWRDGEDLVIVFQFWRTTHIFPESWARCSSPESRRRITPTSSRRQPTYLVPN